MLKARAKRGKTKAGESVYIRNNFKIVSLMHSENEFFSPFKFNYMHSSFAFLLSSRIVL